MKLENYQHPPTFRATDNGAVDFSHSAEDYDINVSPLLPKDDSARILDVGCGWGQFLWWLQSRGFTAIEGIDVGTDQVTHCRSMGLRVEQHADSASFLTARPEQFDVITMHHMIEHVEPPEGLALLRAAHKALRPDGRVIVQTPNMSAVSANYSRYIELTHVTGYTDSSLAEALYLAGIANVTIVGNRNASRWRPRRLLWLALQKAERMLWRAMLVAELGSDAPRLLTKNIYAVGHRSP